MSKYKPGKLLFVATIALLLAGCNKAEPKWKLRQQVKIEGVSQPISMLVEDGKWWISDVGNNQVLWTDTLGKVLKKYTALQRPMHLAAQAGKVYVPEYGVDSVKVIHKGTVTSFPLKAEPDAPAAVAVADHTIAIADFYNNRIILQQGDEVKIVGKEGHEAGEFYYPTDVAWFRDTLYVADAYNNRVQVFDRQGKHLQTMGESEGLHVASGLDVNEQILAVTDQENNRVLLYNHQGEVLQILTEQVDYPTDVFIDARRLYVTNFQQGSIGVYEQE